MHTLGKTIQRGKGAYCLFLDVQKNYDTAVWRNVLRKKLWEAVIEGKMWRMMETITECARSAVMLDGEISKFEMSITT